MLYNELKLELTLQGNGVFNYNGTKPNVSQRNRYENSNFSFYKENGEANNNGSFGKENLYFKLDENGQKQYDYYKIISSNLMRKLILGENNSMTTLMLLSNEDFLISEITSMEKILRGYLILEKKGSEADEDESDDNEKTSKKSKKTEEKTTKKPSISFKRKSPVSVSSAQQIKLGETMAEPQMETLVKEGDRDKTSLFYKETIGELKYKSDIFVDIKNLQFVSMDENQDRVALSDQYADKYITKIKTTYSDCFDVNEIKRGKFITTRPRIGNPFVSEQGINFGTSFSNFAVRYLIEKILDIKSTRSNSYVEFDSLKLIVGKGKNKIEYNINQIEDFDKLNLNFGVILEEEK